jgi:hypothetical protein
MISTTLNRIRDYSPCAPGWETLAAAGAKARASQATEFLRVVGDETK